MGRILFALLILCFAGCTTHVEEKTVRSIDKDSMDAAQIAELLEKIDRESLLWHNVTEPSAIISGMTVGITVENDFDFAENGAFYPGKVISAVKYDSMHHLIRVESDKGRLELKLSENRQGTISWYPVGTKIPIHGSVYASDDGSIHASFRQRKLPWKNWSITFQ